ncbi:hypothetical protein Ac2012v2_001379 [Leucoagaricus gongylophorus]
MSHFSDVARPTMRRKSSAQNLLSSFKSTTSSSQSVSAISIVSPPIQTGSGTISSVVGMSITSAISNSASSTPVVRGDNTEGQTQYANSLVGATSPPLGSSTSVEFLRDMLQKRLVTLTYIRNVFEGRSYWFHTLLINRTGLEKVFNNGDMKKRTYRFATLGLSLSNLLDINSPQDLLRAILNTVTEYDQSKEENDRPRMKPLFKKPKKKGTPGMSEYAGSELGIDASYLMMPYTPFSLDYHETVLSLLDVMSEVYNKISKILGPSSLPHSVHSLGPLASVTPYPGVSYLFASEANNHSTQYPSSSVASASSSHTPLQQSQQPNSASNTNLNQYIQLPSATASSTTLTGSSNSGDAEAFNSLWTIANACTIGMGMGANSQPTVHWSPTYSEMILKIDAKLKKLTALLLKDLDTLARKGIQDELGSLAMLNGFAVSEDPILSNGSGRSLYDYDG